MLDKTTRKAFPAPEWAPGRWRNIARSYTTDELRAFASEVARDGYGWEVGQAQSASTPMGVTYLIGEQIKG